MTLRNIRMDDDPPPPCPSCGYCPTCGRGGVKTYPKLPTIWTLESGGTFDPHKSK